MSEIESNEWVRRRRRYDRERKVRLEAEAIAERVTAELYAATQELKCANEDLARANSTLEGVNQSMRDFLSVASHDLRGPITAVVGFASLMLSRWEEITDDQKREFLEVIKRQSEHLTRLVADLLTISQIETGGLEAQAEELQVARVLEQTVEDFLDKKSEIRVTCPDDLKVLADPDHVHRILVNYISNALNYGRPPVDAEARGAGEWVELRVRDHGEGVPEDLVPRLFEKFARGGLPRNTKERGTGLGLSIVMGLARANGGDAWYERGNNGGPCFAVRLPSARAAGRS